MVQIPPPLRDVFDLASQTISDVGREIPGFGTVPIPSKSGFGVRQSKVPSQRTAGFTRNMMRWFVPETGIVEMYVNPQNVSYQRKKHITRQRTKGGWVLQYWGEELGALNISGTTGSSGIEGINVLEDVYRNEQLAFDPYALAIAAARDAQDIDFSGNQSLFALIDNAGQDASERFFDLVSNAIETGSSNTSRPKPTLADLAFTVELYWSGWVFRGFFDDFRVEERAGNLGLFDYSMTFTYTQRRGIRNNFLGWHRSPTDGPSNTDPRFGIPYSFQSLASNSAVSPAQQNQAPLSIDQNLSSSRPIVNSNGVNGLAPSLNLNI